MLSASVINSSSQSSRLNWQPSQEANFQTASFGFRLRIILDLPFHQQRSQTAILEDRSIFTDEVWPVLTMSTETNAAFHVAFHREKDAFRRYSLLFQLCCCATHQDFRPADHRYRVGWIECCFRDQFGHIADIPAPRARCVPDDDANFKVEAGAPGFQFTLVEQVRGCVGTAQEDNLSILLPPGKNLIDDRAQRCQPQTSTDQHHIFSLSQLDRPAIAKWPAHTDTLSPLELAEGLGNWPDATYGVDQLSSPARIATH